jgi:hypothetical protein
MKFTISNLQVFAQRDAYCLRRLGVAVKVLCMLLMTKQDEYCRQISKKQQQHMDVYISNVSIILMLIVPRRSRMQELEASASSLM